MTLPGRPAALAPDSQFPEEALRQSVQEFPDAKQAGANNDFGSMVYTWNIASSADAITPWGRNVLGRDRELRDFWPTESYLAGAVVSQSFRNVSLDWEIRPPGKVATAVTDMLNSAIAGESFGWVPFMKKFAQDLYTQDNGTFVEMIRDPGTDANSRFKAENAPVLGIAHLDANQCLAGDTRILFEDGSTISIRDVVRHKYGGYVMSLGKNGQLEPKRITNFYETSLQDRYWLRIVFKSPRQAWGRSEGITLTNDHEIYTARGWKRADQIVVGDKVASCHLEPSEEQVQLLVGSLLGDSHIPPPQGEKSKLSYVSFCHGGEQKEWFDLKISALEDFGFNSIRQNYRGQYQSESISNPYFAELRDVFYKNNTKIVPMDIVSSYFSPRMLATWYMDDGNMQTGKWGRPKGRLYTNSFCQIEVERLAELLNEKGITCLVKTSPSQGNKDVIYYWLYITCDGFENLVNMIAEYIPPTMRYKLPPGAKSYNANLWNLEKPQVYFDSVVSINKSENGKQTQAYCIDVEDNHNFVAAGVVVHNCIRTGDPEYPVLYTDRNGKPHKLAWYQVIPFSDFPSSIERMNGVGYCAVSRSLRLAQILRSIMLFKDEKITGRQYKQIHFVSGVSRQDIKDEMVRGQEEANNSGFVRFIMPAILASLDPEKPVSTATIDLANLPDGFDFDQEMRWYISGLALDFGVDYQEFAPLPGGNIGSSQQSMILHRKSSGKGPAVFMRTLTESFRNYGILPRGTTMRFNDKDEQEELERQEVRTKAMEESAIAVNAGILSPEAAARALVFRGILEEKEIEGLEEFWKLELEARKQPVGSRGGNTIVEDSSRQDTGKPNLTVGDRLRKMFGRDGN
jgi:hypothetical protein